MRPRQAVKLIRRKNDVGRTEQPGRAGPLSFPPCLRGLCRRKRGGTARRSPAPGGKALAWPSRRARLCSGTPHQIASSIPPRRSPGAGQAPPLERSAVIRKNMVNLNPSPQKERSAAAPGGGSQGHAGGRPWAFSMGGTCGKPRFPRGGPVVNPKAGAEHGNPPQRAETEADKPPFRWGEESNICSILWKTSRKLAGAAARKSPKKAVMMPFWAGKCPFSEGLERR